MLLDIFQSFVDFTYSLFLQMTNILDKIVATNILMSFFLFHQQFQINDPHTSVEGSQRYSARINDNNELHKEFLIPFEENTVLLKTAYF